ncbi:beta-1,4-glucuronyltransferase 1-like [Macrobrachium rosenbergii]|uniref:beta-1,4-glucuronyltransferase 1-like n=1 Tax=Macrobrachium rosenbergii TaxID=79674 RepID=UPI0034D429CD
MFPRFLSSIVSWRSVAILAFIACLLQVTNLVLSWQLRQRELLASEAASAPAAEIPGSISRAGIRRQHAAIRRRDYHLGKKLSDDHEAILSRIARWSVLDSSGEFRVSVGILRGTGLDSSSDDGPEGREELFGPTSQGLTLVTQCSFGQLHHLPHLASHWQGPVSVAVFALSGEVQAVVQAFHLLRRCYPNIKENVTFSLIFPLNSPTSPHLTPTSDTTPCDKIFSDTYQANYDFKGIQYPNNLLRNTAKKATTTGLMVVIDIDMVPSEGLHEAFSRYAKNNNILDENSSEEKTVWILPAYEIKEGTAIPKTKQDLLKMREKGTARPFYQELCLKCQKYTDYAAWEKSAKGKQGSVEALYEVLWQDPYEPFYISRVNVPSYDERFRQYGFNRISQVCELHVAGYRFSVLDSAFVVHQGFKISGTFHNSKDMEQEKNRVLFRQFKGELKEKYPESSRRCY